MRTVASGGLCLVLSPEITGSISLIENVAKEYVSREDKVCSTEKMCHLR